MAYFDNAATTFPKPECVYNQMDLIYRQMGGSFGRGDNEFSRSAKQLADETRKLIQNLFHCPAKQVVFQPTATISLNVIIQGLIVSGAKNIFVSPFEHNAVTRVLHHYEGLSMITVHQLSVTKDLRYDLQRIQYQFDSDRPDLIIVSHASNVIGLVAPAEKIFQLAKKYGAKTVLDMSQTAGLVDCNIGLESFDFAVFAGHKTLFGPTGISGFVMKPDIVLPPVLFGGTGFESANQEMPVNLPERYEIGTMNTSGLAGLNAALKWINEKGTDNHYSDELSKRERLLALIGDYDFIQIVGDVPGRKYVGIVSCTMNGIASDTAGQLFFEQGIAVRTGLHCAPLAHQFLGTYPAGTIRFSVSCFTSHQDFDELKAALDYIEENL